MLSLPFALYTLGVLDGDGLSLGASLLHNSIWRYKPYDERDNAIVHVIV